MLPYIDVPFQYLSKQIGSGTDEIKLITVFLLSYPLAGLLKRVPDNKPYLKNVFSIVVTLFYLVGLFDLWDGLAIVLADAITIYLIAAYVEGPFMPWIGFVVLMGHMSSSHIYRQRHGIPGSVDITGAQMVMVMKLSSFCWSVWDGKQDPKELNDWQKDRAIKKLPSPLDFAGFVAFFPSFMVGPAFDYADYRRWLETSMFDLPEGTDPAKAPPTRGKRRIPRSGTPATIKMVIGLAWIFAHLQLVGYFNPAFVLSRDFGRLNFFMRVFHVYMMNIVERMKYYGVWTLTEGSCILAGIGYKGLDPKTGKPNWDRLTNIKPWGVEGAQNAHAYLGFWNINTNNWLRNSVYLRVTPKGKKPGFRATLATFVASAFWHGFYPGYYLTFVLAAFMQNVAKNCRRLVRPFFMTPDGSKPTPYKRYYDIFTWVATQLGFAFATTPFIVLTLQYSLRVWAQVYFYCVIAVVAASGFLISPGKTWLSKRVKARTSRPGMARQDSQENMQGAMLGVPVDPAKEFDEMVDEIMEEVKRRRGSVDLPRPEEVRQQVRETLVRQMSSAGADISKVKEGLVRRVSGLPPTDKQI
ncbi:hypothetical protein AMS68_004159 [Peltaster fructicola]|uniref:Uncharacterized protein n=1 Tax=Peltaster fructicola TaxID=286661 RepID=A0A6H0XV53_9PEZI|nr:hypothetical protein AMS68_004159 [Peltaster fructicola]